MTALKYYIDLIEVLTLKEIKVRYKNNIFGYFWSILHPLSLALVYYFAFKFIMKFQIENFAYFLICGLFPWQWFSNSVLAGSNSFLANATLIKKVNFPKFFIPLATVLNDAFHFLASLPVILFFGFLFKKFHPLALFYLLPLQLLVQFILTYGLVLLLASINLFFRDLERLIQIGLTILFYLTPIIYDASFIPSDLKVLFYLNPLFGLIENWRLLFMDGSYNWFYFGISLFEGILIFLLGFRFFKKLSPRFAEVL
jgi:lipopolysaccharide transport system permease protein